MNRGIFVLMGLLLVSGCGGSKNSTPDDAGTGDTGKQIGAACTSDADCGTGKVCTPNASGEKVCLEEGSCVPVGGDCSLASQCCTLGCGAGTCSESICTPEGEGCSDNTDCCSNKCEGTEAKTCASAGEGCKVLGERVTAGTLEEAGNSCCSTVAINIGSESEPDFRCAPASACAARGELCGDAEDCCSKVCIDGHCPSQNQIGGPRFAGEPCQQHQDCATFACASDFPDGPKVCQALDGCRPGKEICTEDWQCCGYYGIANGGPSGHCAVVTTVPGICQEINAETLPGLKTCLLQNNDKEVGEICKDASGNKVHDCCVGNKTQDEICQLTDLGVFRCNSVVDACVAAGEVCSISGQCCEGFCVPGQIDNMSSLVCGSDTECIPDGSACTFSGACCSGHCNDSGVCGESLSSCVPLGGACTGAGQCCDTSTFCSSGTCRIFVF